MPARSKVFDLPPELRDELNVRLVGCGFQDYEGLAAWLTEQGYKISKSALHRYGQEQQAEFEAAMADVKKATDIARAYVTGDADEQDALLDATTRIAKEAVLRITIALRQAEQEPQKAAKQISQIARALADLGRMSINQKKWAHEVRERAEAAADKVAQLARASGTPEDAIDTYRREILGIAS